MNLFYAKTLILIGPILREADPGLIPKVSDEGYFEYVSFQQDQSSKIQGLKHQHNLFSKVQELASVMIERGESIKEKSNRCLLTLTDL